MCMEGHLKDEVASSSAQLSDWAAGVAADLENERGVSRRPVAPRKRRSSDDGSSSPSPSRGKTNASSTHKRSRQLLEKDDAETKRRALPRPTTNDPCPRCESTDTRFAYYNNNNIKQPRFYCKTCQRYWTAGGTLRNIKPGSGRRKSKVQTGSGGPSRHSEPLITLGHDPLRSSTPGPFAGLPSSFPAAGYAGLPPVGLLTDPHATALALGSGAGSGMDSANALNSVLGQGERHSAGAGGLSPADWAGASAGGVPLSLADAGSYPSHAMLLTHGSLSLREQLQLQHQQQQQAGLAAAANLTHAGSSSLDPRLAPASLEELQGLGHGGHRHDAAAQLAALHAQEFGGSRAGLASVSASPSPPPRHDLTRHGSTHLQQQQQYQQQNSSPRPPTSQLSAQPSAPHGHSGNGGGGGGSPYADCGATTGAAPDDGASALLFARRARVKSEAAEGTGACSGPLGPHGLGGSGASASAGIPRSASLSAAQMASVQLPPSMASLAAVMGPSGGGSSAAHAHLAQGLLHPLLLESGAGGERGGGGLLDGVGGGGLTRQELQELAVLHHHHQQQQQQQHQQQQAAALLQMQAAHQQHQQQQQASAAQHAQLLHALSGGAYAQGGAPLSCGHGLAVAALDPQQRAALLQHGGMLAGGGGWAGASGMALLEPLQGPHGLIALPAAGLLHQQQPMSQADFVALAAAGNGAGGPKGHAYAANHALAAWAASGCGPQPGAASLLAAAPVAWPSSSSSGHGGMAALQAAAGGAAAASSPFWSAWPAQGSMGPSGPYAGLSLHAAAAAAYAGGGR